MIMNKRLMTFLICGALMCSGSWEGGANKSEEELSAQVFNNHLLREKIASYVEKDDKPSFSLVSQEFRKALLKTNPPIIKTSWGTPKCQEIDAFLSSNEQTLEGFPSIHLFVPKRKNKTFLEEIAQKQYSNFRPRITSLGGLTVTQLQELSRCLETLELKPQMTNVVINTYKWETEKGYKESLQEVDQNFEKAFTTVAYQILCITSNQPDIKIPFWDDVQKNGMLKKTSVFKAIFSDLCLNEGVIKLVASSCPNLKKVTVDLFKEEEWEAAEACFERWAKQLGDKFLYKTTISVESQFILNAQTQFPSVDSRYTSIHLTDLSSFLRKETLEAFLAFKETFSYLLKDEDQALKISEQYQKIFDAQLQSKGFFKSLSNLVYMIRDCFQGIKSALQTKSLQRLTSIAFDCRRNNPPNFMQSLNYLRALSHPRTVKFPFRFENKEQLEALRPLLAQLDLRVVPNEKVSSTECYYLLNGPRT